METKEQKTKIGFYSIGEEIANAVTHGIGALLAIFGLIACILLSAINGSLCLLSAVLYGISLVMLYCMSTLYHAVTNPRAKSVLRVFDHCSIFLLIAGTYSPFTLVTLRGTLGTALFVAIWAVTVFGIVLNAVDLKKFAKLSVALYILMGWAVVVAIKPLYMALPAAGFYLLVGGGLLYTFGIIFYACKWKYAHFIWHLFVLGGSTLHFLSILLFVF